MTISCALALHKGMARKLGKAMTDGPVTGLGSLMRRHEVHQDCSNSLIKRGTPETLGGLGFRIIEANIQELLWATSSDEASECRKHPFANFVFDKMNQNRISALTI